MAPGGKVHRDTLICASSNTGSHRRLPSHVTPTASGVGSSARANGVIATTRARNAQARGIVAAAVRIKGHLQSSVECRHSSGSGRSRLLALSRTFWGTRQLIEEGHPVRTDDLQRRRPYATLRGDKLPGGRIASPENATELPHDDCDRRFVGSVCSLRLTINSSTTRTPVWR